MSNKNNPVVQSSQVTYSGPLPTSAEFAGYERTLPGAADRVLAMAENEAVHRHQNEDKVITESLKLSHKGQIIGCAVVILSLAIVGLSIFFAQPTASIAPTIVAITGLASLFIGNSKKG
jgi:uncharacterized membrane protein